MLSRVEPRLIEVDHRPGPLFAADYRSGGEAYLLLVPAFAEEMNRSRPMVAWQAREFAKLGVGTLVLDLYGTGDSAGDFGEASWRGWCADVAAAQRWLREHDRRCIGLWGVRLGALLALDVAGREQNAGDSGLERLLLWQPVIDGRTFLTQFLRLRLAATMARSDERRETTAGLRAELAAGRPLEIGGYLLGPELAADLDRVGMTALGTRPRIPARRLDWLELSQKQPPSLSAAAQKAVAVWRDAGVQVDAAAVPGEPFWTHYERSFAPSLIETSCERLAQRP